MNSVPLSVSARCPRCNGCLRVQVRMTQGAPPRVLSLECATRGCPVDEADIRRLLGYPAETEDG